MISPLQIEGEVSVAYLLERVPTTDSRVFWSPCQVTPGDEDCFWQ
jgi:hypothetical protein